MGRMKRTSAPDDDEISLPEELLGNILLSIPSHRVVEFRCLSKFYRDLIKSAEFFEKHYNRSIKANPSVILGEISSSSWSPRNELIVDFDSIRFSATVRSLKRNPISHWNSTVSLVGCCRGILCYTNGTRFHFWNPYTGASRRSFARIYSPIIGKFRCLFGYDALTDDLKLVIIMRGGESVFRFVSEVYSSKTDSWKSVSGLDDYELDIGLWNELGSAFVEGTNCVHILVSDISSCTRNVLAFDFTTERFNLIPIPEQCRGILCSEQKVGLLPLDGYLGLFDKPSHDGLEVWKMKEYGVEESWVRVFSLKPAGLSVMPLAFVNNGRQLLMLSPNYDCGLYLCDVAEEEELKEAIHFINPKRYSFQPPFLISPCLRRP